MPGKRSKDQKLIAFPLDEHLLSQVDAARRGRSRSQYIREALALYLQEDADVVVKAHHVAAPDRAGKGGRPRKVTFPDDLKPDKANTRRKLGGGGSAKNKP